MKNVAHFSLAKKWLLENHVYHAIHHNFTMKTPQQNTIIPRNPL